MDLHYLKIFYEVAREKSFTKAANKLYINQSAVSIQVKKKNLNTNFDRVQENKADLYREALCRMAEDILIRFRG
ncbi:MAG: LysR family transcriptional regulator [Fusobacterium sp.]